MKYIRLAGPSVPTQHAKACRLLPAANRPCSYQLQPLQSATECCP